MGGLPGLKGGRTETGWGRSNESVSGWCQSARPITPEKPTPSGGNFNCCCKVGIRSGARNGLAAAPAFQGGRTLQEVGRSRIAGEGAGDVSADQIDIERHRARCRLWQVVYGDHHRSHGRSAAPSIGHGIGESVEPGITEGRGVGDDPFFQGDRPAVETGGREGAEREDVTIRVGVIAGHVKHGVDQERGVFVGDEVVIDHDWVGIGDGDGGHGAFRRSALAGERST